MWLCPLCLLALSPAGLPAEAWTAPETAQARQWTLRQLTEQPEQPRALLDMARLELELGRPSPAIALGHRLVELGGRTDAALVLLAQAYHRKALVERASTATPQSALELALEDAAGFWKELASRHPDEASFLVREGACRLDAGEIERALDLARKALEMAPQAATAVLLMGQCRLAQYVEERARGVAPGALKEAFAEADRWLSRARFIDPQLAEAFVALGDLRAWAEEPEEAALFWRDALLIDPGNEDVHSALSETIMESERSAERLPSLLEGVVQAAAGRRLTRKQRAIPLMWLGRSLLELRRFDEAVAAFNRAAIEWPLSGRRARLSIAIAYHGQNDYERASQTLLGILARRPGELAEAIAEEKHPEHLRASLRFHVDRLVKANRLAEARDLQRELVLLEATSSSELNNLAYLCRETGRYQESYERYCQALALAPQDARLLNDAAVILHHYLKRDLTEARQLYEQAIAAAERVLADPASNPAQREEARSALQDAKSNLEQLGKVKPAGTQRKRQ
ncbi:MAG: tetratricopeptide repeat protein [Planctomycetota bacterium]